MCALAVAQVGCGYEACPILRYDFQNHFSHQHLGQPITITK